MTWADAVAQIKASLPRMRENLLRMDELDRELRERGVDAPQMSPILAEAIRLVRR